MLRSRRVTPRAAAAPLKKNSQPTTSTKDIPEQQKAVVSFRDNFSASLLEAAKRAKVKLLNGEVSMAVRGDFAIANALIAPPKGVPIEEADKLFFVYISLPKTHALAGKLTSGFYTMERMVKHKNPRVKVVNLSGKTVLELPLNVRKIEKSPEAWDGESLEPVAIGQATIEQAHETLYRNVRMQAHGVICYPRDGVWYWTWA